MKRAPILLAAVLATACARSSPTVSASTTTAAPASAPAIEAPPPAGPSLYPMKLALHDQRGEPLALDAFRGHPVLVSMFYGSCPVACPLIVSNVKAVDAHLGDDARARTRVLLVSFDPEHDTPDALGAIAKKRALDPTRWTLATGSDADVRELAAALGVAYRKLPEGGFAHTSVIAALDGEGRIVAREEGAEPNVDALARAVERAAKGDGR